MKEARQNLLNALIGGVIMDVTNADQAKTAEDAGASAVMALERVPSDIRKAGGVARMSDPQMIREICSAVSIPVMAKVRIGHTAEALMLQELGIDMIDESEVLTPADEKCHIWKREFTSPFVCGAADLGEALRRIDEGAAMIRTKGQAGTGNVAEAVRHQRMMQDALRSIHGGAPERLASIAKELQAPYDLLSNAAETGALPVPNFAAGGIATPADAVLMMRLGSDGVFVGSGIFTSREPVKRARAIVEAVKHWRDVGVLLRVSEGLGEAMTGIVQEGPSGDQQGERSLFHCIPII